jgi:hypothetical protein
MGLPAGIDQPLIQVMFFYLSNGVPTGTVVAVNTNAAGGDVRGTVSTGPITGMRWGSAGAMVNELDRGTDPRFDDMRNHPVLSRFFKEKEHPALLSTAGTLKLLPMDDKRDKSKDRLAQTGALEPLRADIGLRSHYSPRRELASLRRGTRGASAVAHSTRVGCLSARHRL